MADPHNVADDLWESARAVLQTAGSVREIVAEMRELADQGCQAAGWIVDSFDKSSEGLAMWPHVNKVLVEALWRIRHADKQAVDAWLAVLPPKAPAGP